MSSTQPKSLPDGEVCIEYLALLIYEKNCVNRVRRRTLAAAHRAGYEDKPRLYSEYERLKAEGRSRTPAISVLRKKLNIQLQWDSSGYCIQMSVVKKVKFDNGLSYRHLFKRIELPEINSMAINYATESLLR